MRDSGAPGKTETQRCSGLPQRSGPQKWLGGRSPFTASLILVALLALFAQAALTQPATLSDKVSHAQKAAVLDFLQAVASGDPQTVASTIHPDDLHALRLRILTLLRGEAGRGDSTVRSRLFGEGMPLDALEHLTDTGFYATLADKLSLSGREYSDVEGLAALPDQADRVQIVVRARQPKDHGKVQVVTVVTVRPYGKDWKASLPNEIEAQIDDLIDGRHVAPSAGARTSATLPAIVELLAAAEKSLLDERCEDYYSRQMSPDFRQVTGKKAVDALIASCRNGMGTRQLLLTTLRIVRGLEPRYENESRRAVYDLSGQGLPFNTFSVEQLDRQWYIAE